MMLRPGDYDPDYHRRRAPLCYHDMGPIQLDRGHRGYEEHARIVCCTLRRGHADPHIAHGNGGLVLAVSWADDATVAGGVVKLPGDYVMPKVGDIDFVGDATDRGETCNTSVGDYICTLPIKHWCDFHVAHDGSGEVLAVRKKRVPKHLQLQEGL